MLRNRLKRNKDLMIYIHKDKVKGLAEEFKEFHSFNYTNSVT